MARIKLSLPQQLNFSCKIPVRITDINYGGHAGNDALLGIIHEARLQFLKHYNYSEMDFAGTGLIMADVAIEFKQEAFYGEAIIVSVGIGDIQKVSFDIYYKLEKLENSQPITIALAKTGMVCYNYTAKKVSAFPAAALPFFLNPAE